jgi:phosphoglycolate phosphatase
MEHIPCDITSVLWHLHRATKKTGYHIFCVPVLPGYYAEDLGDLTSEERTKRFGQFDHVRRFGDKDFDKHLGKVFHLKPYDYSKLLTPDIAERHCINIGPAHIVSSNTFFIQRKQDLKLQ